MPIFPGAHAPALKLALALGVAFLLCVPLFSVWLLVYDRQSQFRDATASITQGWGSEQTMSGPVLVIPYRTEAAEPVVLDRATVAHTNQARREFTLVPEVLHLTSEVRPEVRKRSIYEAIVYDAKVAGTARFALPTDLGGSGLDISKLDLRGAELRFGLTDPGGLGSNPRVNAGPQALRLHPGAGSMGGAGFFAWIDASQLASGAMPVDFSFDLHGNGSLSVAPDAEDTVWNVRSSWPSPSFAGEFLPVGRRIGHDGFEARYRIGNLALGRSLIESRDPAEVGVPAVASPAAGRPEQLRAKVSLIEPVDPYSQVNRATKYGFLFIGFTFLALLMFEVIGGVPVSSVEYLLMGAALVLFFVLLLAFAEVIGFNAAYVLASAAIAGLNTSYGSAVLGSWRRAAFIGGLLVGLYAVLYVLLTLEAYSLLIGSILLFAALSGVMYATRHIDWGKEQEEARSAR